MSAGRFQKSGLTESACCKNKIMKIIYLFIFSLFQYCSSVDLRSYEFLKEPRIAEKKAMKMLVYELEGDPSKTAGQAYPVLFRSAYRISGARDGMEKEPPRARWPKPLTSPRENWIGIFALPVNDSVKSIPEDLLKEYNNLRLETWEYGLTAEILHIGAYTKEEPTVGKLHDFIKSKGYKISGVHEEEYLKTRGIIFAGSEDEYYTIIRYPVKK